MQNELFDIGGWKSVRRLKILGAFATRFEARN
jgi:hypothetical protein